MNKIGISNLALYIPYPKIELSELYKRRISDDPSLERRLRRAISITGQEAIRFPQVFEDNASIAANAAKKLVSQMSAGELNQLRYLTIGTETTVDLSKPISSYVAGMLQRSGLELPTTLSSFQVQHACAGGTLALLSVSGLLNASPRADQSGIILCSDIARYDAPSTAEVTQGAGAVALLVEKNPKLLELDITSQGYSSRDVDDFFRPLDSVTAKVKGSYSVQCYHDALDEAFQDHCRHAGQSPKSIMEETDFFIFHVPYVNMAIDALKQMLYDHLGLKDAEADSFLNSKGFTKALESTAQIGNLYTGALYLNLASQLQLGYSIYGDSIIGKKVLFSSYGSGNTMIVMSGTIAPEAPAIIKGWNLGDQLNHDKKASFDEYNSWIHLPKSNSELNRLIAEKEIPPGLFYLQEIREDGYRSYGFSR